MKYLLPSSKATNLNYNSSILDYFPYGKIVRSYINGDEERYLTTQHERDAETGLDYRGARYYDSDIARFLSLDPLAADYSSWSAYNYVLGNPIMFIDPTGMAVEDIGIYTVDAYGNVTHVKTVESDQDYDMLYKEKDWREKEYHGDRIRVNDQSILEGLSDPLDQFIYYGSLGRSSEGKADDVMKVFKYVADNSSVEWTVVQGTINKHFSTKIATAGESHNAIDPFTLGFDYGGVDMQIHSHRDFEGRSTRMADEVISMGKRPDGMAGGDWSVSIAYKKANLGRAVNYNVYFATSKRVYNVNVYKGPIYNRTIESFRDFQYRR